MVVNAVNDTTRKRLPPYISYRTFRNFVDSLQVGGIPARIDRSYWGDRLSGTTGTQLMTALRFLGLIDANSIPTNRLRLLVSARGPQKTELLRQIAYEAFTFIFRSSFDPQNGTYSQLEEIFHSQFELTGDVSRKCIKFFLMLASDAGIHLSSFITKRLKTPRSGTGARNSKKVATRTSGNSVVPEKTVEMPYHNSWDTMVLNKFPTFDPAWSEEVKLKWFDAFNELLKIGSSARGSKAE